MGFFHRSGKSVLFQIQLISMWITERIVLPHFLIILIEFLSLPGGLYLLNFSVAIVTSKE
jgi:hypothetical protein